MSRYTIPESELDEQFTRSGGPGGQNVNKVATAVHLRFDLEASGTLPAAVRERLREIAGNRVDKHGVLLIRASSHRTQEANRADARQRLQALVDRAARPPKKRKRRRGESRGAKERRHRQKRKRSELKQSRKAPKIRE